MAELRHQLRLFLHHSEEAARAQGLLPQHCQLMLAIKGMPDTMAPSIVNLAQRMCLRHHSTVELINRLVATGVAVRQRDQTRDRRIVRVSLTPVGEDILRSMQAALQSELSEAAPALLDKMRQLLEAGP